MKPKFNAAFTRTPNNPYFSAEYNQISRLLIFIDIKFNSILQCTPGIPRYLITVSLDCQYFERIPNISF